MLWTLWIQRNEAIFENKRRRDEKVGATIWQGITDYGRAEWSKVKEKLRKNATAGMKFLRQFDNTWMKSRFFGVRQGLEVKWWKFLEVCAQLVDQPIVVACPHRIQL